MARVTGEAVITAALLVIGEEILSGRTKDRNIGIVADHLATIGIRLREVRIVGDDETAIAAAVNALRHSYSYVFTTGGIGPTHDDVTADSIGSAFGVPVGIDPAAVALMRPYAEVRGVALNEARLRMARIPEGAVLVPNTVSAAPGFMIGNVIVMAGIPEVASAMLASVTPRLETGARLRSESISLDRPEGDIAELFALHQRAYPAVLMGSYPVQCGNGFRTELVLRATDQRTLTEAADSLRARLKAHKT